MTEDIDLPSPQTAFEVPETSKAVTDLEEVESSLAGASETETPSEPEKPLDEAPVTVSEQELESAMSSFSEEAVEAEANREETVVNQDKAVADMLSELQKANPDKIFDKERTLDDSSLFLLSDEIGTKLDLAKAYIEMGDQEGAKDLLKEVMDEGNSHQKDEAKELLELTD